MASSTTAIVINSKNIPPSLVARHYSVIIPSSLRQHSVIIPPAPRHCSGIASSSFRHHSGIIPCSFRSPRKRKITLEAVSPKFWKNCCLVSWRYHASFIHIVDTFKDETCLLSEWFRARESTHSTDSRNTRERDWADRLISGDIIRYGENSLLTVIL